MTWYRNLNTHHCCHETYRWWWWCSNDQQHFFIVSVHLVLFFQESFVSSIWSHFEYFTGIWIGIKYQQIRNSISVMTRVFVFLHHTIYEDRLFVLSHDDNLGSRMMRYNRQAGRGQKAKDVFFLHLADVNQTDRKIT